MSLYEELSWRGFIHQCTDDTLWKALGDAPVKLYCGFDPTADSLHIGSLLPIMGLAHFQRAGHSPIILVGGGTGMIGDPSGKTEERSLLDDAAVSRNSDAIGKQLSRFLEFEGEGAAVMVNNADWLGKITLIEFLRDIGKHFSVNVMLTRESVRQRLEDREHGISYTEFTYSLLQAYDFLHLCRERDCVLQVGGSDQWGNIVAGMDLTRRMLQKDTFGLTFPLVTKADGGKFGKTESGNIWLDPARTSPYKFYQFWINQSDVDTPKYLRFFTFLDKGEVEKLERQILEEPHQRTAQKKLAEEITRIVHGEDALHNAVKASQAMFGGELTGMDEATLLDIFSEVPSHALSREVFETKRSLLEVLIEAEVFASKGEAKRMIQNGGLYLNGVRVEDEGMALDETAQLTESVAVVRKGKKNYYLLRFE